MCAWLERLGSPKASCVMPHQDPAQDRAVGLKVQLLKAITQKPPYCPGNSHQPWATPHYTDTKSMHSF